RRPGAEDRRHRAALAPPSRGSGAGPSPDRTGPCADTGQRRHRRGHAARQRLRTGDRQRQALFPGQRGLAVRTLRRGDGYAFTDGKPKTIAGSKNRRYLTARPPTPVLTSVTSVNTGTGTYSHDHDAAISHRHADSLVRHTRAAPHVPFAVVHYFPYFRGLVPGSHDRSAGLFALDHGKQLFLRQRRLPLL